jgi:hypothetical protein
MSRAGASSPTGDPALPPIIQYWDSDPPPEPIADLLLTFREHNPAFTHIVFSESAAETFIAEHFGPREVEAFGACLLPAMQADYLRYCAVYALGGIYADADYQCLRALEPLVGGCDGGDIFFNHTRRILQQVLNGFFVFPSPRHPFLGLALEVASANIDARIAERVWPVGHRVRQAVGLTTGPGIFAFMYFLRELGSFDAFIKMASGTNVEPFARNVCEVVDVYDRIPEVFEGVRISPYEAMMEWVGHPHQPLAYKRTEAFWMNATMPIFRELRR